MAHCKDKKKKKKKNKKDEKKAAPVAAPITAQGKAILLRQQQNAEHEALTKALQAEEDRKYNEKQAQEEAELKAIEDEKDRKRRAKQGKIDSQKAAGTYMTKAEREKAKKLQDKLESMRATGVLPDALSSQQGGPTAEAGNLSERYAKKKPVVKIQNQISTEASAEKEEEVKEVVSAIEELKVEEATTADWEDDDEDDWDTNTNYNKISAFSEQRAAHLAEDVEDTLVLENKEKFEKLRVLGIERAKRDEETRLRRYGTSYINYDKSAHLKSCRIYRLTQGRGGTRKSRDGATRARSCG